jgi:hypothetical protein
LKLVLEIITVVVTFAVMGGCSLANWFTYDSMVADLNRSLPPSQRIPVIFGNFDSRTWLFNVLKEHKKQFPDSKLSRRLFFFLVLQLVALGLLAWELSFFTTFRLFH